MTRPRAFVAWSSGKDAAFALQRVAMAGEIEVAGLFTTVRRGAGRVAMHGVREALLEAQAAAIGIPLTKLEIPDPCPNEVYERALAGLLGPARERGISQVVFGDLFLADIRAYREAVLTSLGLTAVFPLWGRDTGRLAREMIASGLAATLVCVDPARLDRSFAGRGFDGRLLADLPASVDPCGENGEFHTFVTNGPMFAHPVAAAPGTIIDRGGFTYADLVPVARRSPSRRVSRR